MLASLRHAGLMRFTTQEKLGLVRDAAAIDISAIIDAARCDEHDMPLDMRTVPACAAIVGELKSALHDRFAGRTLSERVTIQITAAASATERLEVSG